MIVFPMVGMSRRFREAGYDRPKYMLPLAGGTCFDYSVMGFRDAFAEMIFVMRADFDTPEFVRQRLAALGITGAKLVVLDAMTAGQAETVERGLEGVDDAGGDGLAIFNIDTFRPGFVLPPRGAGDGYLEVFVGEGANWSFVEDDGSGGNRAARTTEKVPISDLCCTGLYHFARIGDFRDAVAAERAAPSSSELYVAPAYNHLIAAGRDIRYDVVDPAAVVFCGVPAEYETLQADEGAAMARLFAGEAAGVKAALVALFILSAAVNVVAAAADPSWWTIPALLAGWYLADLLSGIVHMTMDYRPCPRGHGLAEIYFYEGSRESEDYQRRFRTAMQGLSPVQRLVYDFKNHHPRPDALGRRGLWRLIGSSVLLGALPVSLLLSLAWLAFGLPGWAMAGGVALLAGGTFAQYFHATLHRAENPALIGVLRRLGLLMTPAAHARHHATLRQDFGTNCGWSNPLLNRLFGLGRRRGLFRDEGLEPHR